MLFVSCCYLLALLAFCILNYEPFTFANFDPGWMVSAVESLSVDGDIDLRNQLQGNPELAEDQIALGKNGAWYPVHEPLVSFLALPFYKLFGINGCLAFNFIASWMLCLGVYLLCREHETPAVSLSASALTCIGTVVQRYSYSFSIDVLGACFLVYSILAMMRHHTFCAGVSFGLGVLSRTSTLIALPAIVCLLVAPSTASKSFRRIGKFILGGLPFAALWCISNWHMFGSPFSTSYQNWAVVQHGALVVQSQLGLFDSNLFPRLWTLLIDSEIGLFVSFPMLPLAILLGLPELWKRDRTMVVFLALAMISYLIFFSTYSASNNTGGGNRYLLAIGAIYAIPLAAAISRCANWE